MVEKKDVTQRSSEELRGDTGGTRPGMEEMNDEHEGRFSPRNMAGNLMDNVGNSDAFRAVRENPIPAALIGAGIGWLIIDSLTGGREYRTMEDYEEDPWQSGSDRDWSRDDIDELSEAGDGGTSKVKRAASSIKDRIDDLAGRAGGTVTSGHDYDESGDTEAGRLSGIASRASSATRRLASGTREHSHDAQLGFWQAMERSPLGIGAIAFALGVAGGLAIPTTRWEDERMGLASETLKREAKGAARDIGQTARRVAKDAARAAGQDARNLGGSGTITERAKHVVTSAKDAAMEAAQREDLAGSVRNRAKGAISQIKESSSRGSDTH